LLLNVEEWYASSVVFVQARQLERHHPLDIGTTQDLNPITMMEITILETKPYQMASVITWSQTMEIHNSWKLTG
jgi:hypothetical protein